MKRHSGYDPTQTGGTGNGWLSEVLCAYREASAAERVEAPVHRVSSAFREKCRDAARVALSIARMRRERERLGFVPLGLAEYVEGLAKITGVSLSPVLSRHGLANLATVGSDSVRKLAELARELGFSVRETLAHVGIQFARQLGGAPLPLLARYYGLAESGPSELEECEAALSSIERGYDQTTRSELRRVRAEVRSVYESGQQTEL